MFCMKCGTQLPDDALFCMRCGFQIPQGLVDSIVNNSSVASELNDLFSSKALICNMCHSNNMVLEDGFYVCQSCGTRYTKEEAKKLTLELTGSVKIDHSEELQNLYKLARNARDINDYVSAQDYYNQALLKDPDNWEPNFFIVYCQEANTSPAGIITSTRKLLDNTKRVLYQLKNQAADDEETYYILRMIVNLLSNTSRKMFQGLNNYFMHSLPQAATNDNKRQLYSFYKPRLYSCLNFMFGLGDLIMDVFGYVHSTLATNCWLLACNHGKEFINMFGDLAFKFRIPTFMANSDVKEVHAKINSYTEKSEFVASRRPRR